MRNESCRQLVKQVDERQQQPFVFNIDIDGLLIHPSVKQLIINHYTGNLPFGLSTEDHRNVVYFLPTNGIAVWCDDASVTLNKFQTPKQFEDCIKLVLVAHRIFLGVRQIAGHDRYKEICEQLNGSYE